MSSIPYIVRVLGIWRDSNNNLEPSGKVFELYGPTKEAAYSYVTYFAGHNGLTELFLQAEGPLGNVVELEKIEETHNEKNKEPTKKSTARKATTRKKSKAKR